MRCTNELQLPATVEQVAAFCGNPRIPPSTSLTIVSRIKHGGTQRDPEESVEHIALQASWEE